MMDLDPQIFYGVLVATKHDEYTGKDRSTILFQLLANWREFLVKSRSSRVDFYAQKNF